MTQRHSERVRAPENADALAAALRKDTASDDDMLRMERGLVRAMRERRVAAPSRAPRLVLAVGGLALAAAAIFWLTRPSPAPVVAEHMPAPVVPAPPSIPTVHAGSALAAGEAQLQHARLTLAEGALARVDDDDLAHAAITLARGEIHVAFHPEHRGQEHLAIVTETARVEVVGTEFTVTRRGDGATHVVVSEGVVRVTETAGGVVHEVRAGDEVEVVVPSLSESESESESETVSAHRRVVRDVAAEIAALEEQADAHRSTPALFIADCDRILALDPHGSRGATALFDRADRREHIRDAAAADDFALYLSRFPHGELAAQARQHLCALDAARCPQP